MTTKIPVELSSTPGIVDGSNATAITIDSSENVGIGQTSPSSPNGATDFLHIGNSSSTFTSLVLEDNNNTWEIFQNNQLSIRDGTDTRLLIDTSGNVGIGTTSPSATLHLANAGPSIKLEDTDNNSDYEIKNGNGTFRIIDTTNSTDRLNILSSGNVGIGTTSPNEPLTIRSSSENINCTLLEIGNDVHATNTKDAWMKFVAGVPGADGSWAIGAYPGSFRFAYLGDRSTAPTTASAEVMRLDSSSNLLLGTTASGVGTARHTVYNDASNIAQILVNANGTANGTPVLRLYHYEANSSTNATQIQFLNRSGIQVGYIASTGSATAYNTSSDYRLKENVRPIENGLDRLNSLNPVKFDWKKDGTSSEGFIAHEVQEIFSDAISGEKDGEDMQGMDYGRITPLLVKAIQEQQEQIEQLKTEIQTLKGE